MMGQEEEGKEGPAKSSGPGKSTMTEMRDVLSEKVIGAAIEVHRILGPGLLESAYEECLCRELALLNLAFERQVSLPVEYKGVRLDCGYRMDIVVECSLVVEIKTVERLLPVHQAQILTYLRLSGLRRGLLINFHSESIRSGLKRCVLNYRPESACEA